MFYYLLAGANEQEKQLLHLESCDRYNYLNKSGCYGLENIDERHEFSRLKQSMEMVGFTAEKQRRLFAVLSAVLLLGDYQLIHIHGRREGSTRECICILYNIIGKWKIYRKKINHIM